MRPGNVGAHRAAESRRNRGFVSCRSLIVARLDLRGASKVPQESVGEYLARYGVCDRRHRRAARGRRAGGAGADLAKQPTGSGSTLIGGPIDAAQTSAQSWVDERSNGISQAAFVPGADCGRSHRRDPRGPGHLRRRRAGPTTLGCPMREVRQMLLAILVGIGLWAIVIIIVLSSPTFDLSEMD
jgi:hypothetical protein